MFWEEPGGAKCSKRVLKWVAITLSSPLFSGTLPSFPGPVLEPISSPCKAAASSKPPFTSHSLLGSCKPGEKRPHLTPEGNTEWSLDGDREVALRKVTICACPGALGSPGCSPGSRRGAVLAVPAQCPEAALGTDIPTQLWGSSWALPGLPGSRWSEAAEDRTTGTTAWRWTRTPSLNFSLKYSSVLCEAGLQLSSCNLLGLRTSCLLIDYYASALFLLIISFTM